MTAPPRGRSRRPNPFDVLGISPMAEPAEITSAYRRLAKKYHPDKYAERPEKVRKAAEQRMQELNEAYKRARSRSRDMWDDVDGEPRGGRTSPWTGSDVGAWSRTAKRTESEAARRVRMAMARDQAERAARAHESQARMFRVLRNEARKQAQYGDAVARSRSSLSKIPSTLYGAGQAAHSNELACRACKVIQRLPTNWQDQLIDTVFFCSSCNTLLLSR
ncbi:MAG: J domain-containing protein [Acidimicrobiales bacterium]